MAKDVKQEFSGCQNGRVSCSEEKKVAVPRTKTAAELTKLAPLATIVPQRLSGPASAIARLRDPTDTAASADTVRAVPEAMAKVARISAHIKPCDAANMMTSKAPVQGLMPSENDIARALLQYSRP